MGAVFLAFDPMIEREIAIKVLPLESLSSRSLEHFLSEARATGKLNHPNVVAIYDIAEQEGLYYLVMELVRGSGVAVINRKVISWQQSCEIVAAAIEGWQRACVGPGSPGHQA